ncbi:unnamed protein product [Sympodiomycopsis kandeliae]
MAPLGAGIGTFRVGMTMGMPLPNGRFSIPFSIACRSNVTPVFFTTSRSLYTSPKSRSAPLLGAKQPRPPTFIGSQVRTQQSNWFIRFNSTQSQSHSQPHSQAKTPEPPSQPSKENPAGKSPSLIGRLVIKVRDAILQSAAKAASRSGTGSGSDRTIAPPTYPDLRRLFSLAGPERKTLALALALLLVSSAVSLLIPFTIGKIIDFFTAGSKDTDGKGDAKTGDQGEKKIYGMGFKSVVAVLLFVFATGAAAKAGSNIMLNLAGVRIVRRIREKCFGNAVKQDVEWADKSHGDVISRLSVDTSIVGDAVTYELGDGLRSFLTVIFSGTTMFLISPSLTLLMMGVVPPAAIGAVFYGRYLRDLTNKTQEAVGQMTRTAEERLNSAAFRTVTAFNAQGIEQRRFAEKVKGIADLETKETYASGFFYAGTGFVGNCSILVLLTYGGSLVSRGVITVGDLTSLLMYTAYLGGGLANMTSFFASLMKGVGAGARVFQLIDRSSEVPLEKGRSLTPQETSRGKIEFKGVHFAYPSRPGVKVLDGIDLTINQGESVALVGGSGVGKSSVHALMLRYYDPDSGKVTYGGADISEINPESLRDQLAVVTQDPVLFTGTIFENIAYGCDPPPSREQVKEAATMANCWEFISQLPNGLDESIGARQLSGGQRQRVAIARALCRKPKVLLLDEATSALDSASEHLVNKSIGDIIQQGQITVWIVAHRLSTIKSAGRIMVLKEGKIVESGSFEELDRPGSAFRQLVGSQIERDDEADNGSLSNEQPQAASIPSGRRAYSTSARDDEQKQDLEYARSPGSNESYTPSHPAIPSRPTWSIHSLLHATGLHDEAVLEKSVSTEQLLKLHKLSALEPPSTEAEMNSLKESLRESMRLVDIVKQGEIDSSTSSKGAFHEIQSESARVIDWEHEHGKDGSLGAFFAETFTIEDQDEHKVKISHDSFGLGSGEDKQGTEVLDKKELLSRAQKSKGGYFYVKRNKNVVEE